jgi:predicted phage terminase large subunit-like protein
MADEVVKDDAYYERLEQVAKAARRQLAHQDARQSLVRFIEVMMPNEDDPTDVRITEYKRTAHGKLFCEIIEGVEAGRERRVAVAIPPQHGKTIHLSTFGPAWILGRNPKAKIVIATYNETRAEELGEAFRKVVLSADFQGIFPNCRLNKDSRSKTAMTTTAGGKIFFVGTGGTVTGRTAEYFIVDDPTKDDEELQSEITREKLWAWFFAVAYSRGNKKTRIVVLHTRWHGDDLIGRLCDPDHPERRKRFKGIADDWRYINLSGVITDKALADALGLELKVPTEPKVIDAFGTAPMVALWEEDKDLAHFAQWKIGDPRTFSALVMGKPVPDEGEYFRREWLIEYEPHELPTKLRKFGASDHAVSVKAGRDYTVIGCVGVDENDDIWVLPDLVWDRMETTRTVEELIHQFQAHKPNLWWMEDELISKSFGPFLRKRMQETKTYVTLDPQTPSKDKRTRARAIQGRMQMKKVRFPGFAPWWADARSQMLQFDHGANDDFVDFMSHIGLGLMKEIRPGREAPDNDNIVRVGGPRWILQQSKRRAMQEQRIAANRGW